MDDLKLYGGPGCGKTRGGMDWLCRQIDAGYDLERVAFIGYTNAAVDEAKSRLNQQFGETELPYSRTLHSLCKRALSITHDDWLADKHLEEFGEQHGYSLKKSRKRADDGDLDELALSSGADMALLQIWDFARHRMITDIDAGFRAFALYDPDAAIRVPLSRFRAFVQDYEAWKNRSYLRDYTDLLLELAENPVSIPVSIALIDEAQDLSPLMWRCADILFENAELRATLGDDDQAIYSFSGAEPQLMNERQAAKVVKLSQSYRLPAQIVKVANWIINQNSSREPKDLIPLNGNGYVGRVSHLSQLPLSSGTWYLLVRNWKLAEVFSTELEHQGLPYRIAGNRYSPWDERGPLKAAQALLTLSRGAPITLTELLPVLDKTSTNTSKTPGVWQYGSKARIKGEAKDHPGRPVSWTDLQGYGMTEESIVRLLRADLGLLSPKISARDLAAYENARTKQNFGAPVRIAISTIHAAKGREAENVCLLLGCTGAPARAMLHPHRAEEERRAAYVGVTRAQKSLYTLQCPPGAGLFPWELVGV